jgi:peptide/nickel transport system permease protein
MKKRFKNSIRLLRLYPTAIVSIIIIGILAVVSIVAVTTIPFGEAIRLWRGSDGVWDEAPKTAAPTWTNWFRDDKLPETIITRSTALTDEERTVEVLSPTITRTTFDLAFDYQYIYYPKELSVFLTSTYASLRPQAALTWLAPDGREVELLKDTIGPSVRYSISGDQKLKRKLDGISPTYALFFASDAEMPESGYPPVLEGTYRLRIETMTFEADSSVDAKLVVYGHVYGSAGTDHKRRDLMVGLLWGTPIALMFGLLAAVGSSVLTFFIAAIGVWYGGWIDALIQRVTEVNLMLPVLPILIMIGTFYTTTIWTVLGIIILLNIFSGAIKTYRAMFMQVKNSPYIEAARAYGASNLRIIFYYMIPKVAPVLIPNFVILTPAYVFLEASLAVLGLGDPVMPTWGKMLNDAYQGGALYKGQFYWVLEPAIMLMFTGLAFSMLGFALDRIFNPRLRGQ